MESSKSSIFLFQAAFPPWGYSNHFLPNTQKNVVNTSDSKVLPSERLFGFLFSSHTRERAHIHMHPYICFWRVDLLPLWVTFQSTCCVLRNKKPRSWSEALLSRLLCFPDTFWRELVCGQVVVGCQGAYWGHSNWHEEMMQPGEQTELDGEIIRKISDRHSKEIGISKN